MIQYFLYKFGLFIIHIIPRRWSYRFAEWVARRHFRDSAKDRDAVLHNLAQITGSKDGLEGQALQVFLNFGRYLVDFFLMYKTVTRAFVERHVSFIGREHFDRALSAGKGGIILTAHIGNWEMGAAVLDKLGHPVTAIALPHKNPKVNILFNKQREAHGVCVVPTTSAVRRCIEALRKNRLVAVLGDRDFGTFGATMDFLGRKTLIPKGAVFFSFRTGAPIIPSFLTPDGQGHYTMHFFDPIFPPENARMDDEAAMVAVMAKYVRIIEGKIKENPTQWLMFREFGVEFEDLYSNTRA